RGHRAEDRAANLHAVRPVIAVADDVGQGFTSRVFRLRIALAFGAPRGLHSIRSGRRHLLQGLEDDLARLPELIEPAHEPGVRIARPAIVPDLRLEVNLLVHLVRIEATQVDVHAARAQVRTGDAPVDRVLGGNLPDPFRAHVEDLRLLEDALVLV